MSARKQPPTITHTYSPEPDDCARALSLLLGKPVNKAAEPAPEPDGYDDAKESNGCIATRHCT